MKIEDAIRHLECMVDATEQNPCEQPLRTDLDIVECYTGGVIKEGCKVPAWATSEKAAVRLWYEAAREYYHQKRIETFNAYLMAADDDHDWRAYHPKITLVWRVKPELMPLTFKYFCPGQNDPESPKYSPYVDAPMWNVRARFGIKYDWQPVKSEGRREILKPTTPDETETRDEALLRAVGTLR